MKILSNRYFYYVSSVLLVLALIAYFSAAFLMQYWWFDTLKLSFYFVKRVMYRDVIVLAVTLIFTLIIYTNLIVIPKIMHGHLGLRKYENPDLDHTEFKISRFYAKKFLIPLSILLALPVLIPVADNWEDFLLYFFSAQSNLTDPAYGKNISFYLFSFPVYNLIQDKLLLVFVLLFAVAGLCYWNVFSNNKKILEHFPKPAKIHLTVLVALIVLTEAWSITLEGFELLYDNHNDPVFFGPGIIDMKYRLPQIWLTFASFLALASCVIYFIHLHRGKKAVFSFLLIYAFLLGLKHVQFIPDMIDRYYVKPNPVLSEKKYIQYHIDATLDAFDLNRVEIVDYPVLSSLTSDAQTEIYNELNDIPIWDHELLKDVYEQLQVIRPFYTFTSVAVDRYKLEGNERQVNIAARELLLKKLPKSARNWENDHMKYTHGYGAVVSPAAQRGGQPMHWLLSEISLNTVHEKLKLEYPDIYFGLGRYPYAIVPNKAPTPVTASIDMQSVYKGTAGMAMSSLLTKGIISAFMQDKKIFFSSSITKQSKILIHRNIIERIKTIAPFLQLDANPYPVIVDKKIYWIVDAYTTSDRYPIVKTVRSPFPDIHAEYGDESLNYIRNSIKIVVDAYNGSVKFYITDPNDVIAETYRRIFPGLFKPIAQMPKPLIKHLSYPQDLFAMQMQIYARFHQTEPEVFYQQSNALELASMDGKAIPPYYLTIDILDRSDRKQVDQEKFIMVTPFSPIGRDNLYSVAIGGCLDINNCHEQYSADIYVYKFPETVQVDGPGQVSALVNQNTDISRQFTLWGQRGSRVIRGRMFVIPVERSVLYIQPVYLAATAKTGFPQLAKVIVAMNQQSAMADTVEEAYREVLNKISENQTP